MIKELNYYQFNLLDTINERVNARLKTLKNTNCEVYQNKKRAIIICNKNKKNKEVYVFSKYKESLLEVEDNDKIAETIKLIMGGK